MRKGQLSLEFLVYLSLAGLALLFSASMLHESLPAFEKSMGYDSALGLASRINEGMLLAQAQSNITPFLPQGMCKAYTKGRVLYTAYGNFTLLDDLSLGRAFCPDGTESQLVLAYNAGQFQLTRLS